MLGEGISGVRKDSGKPHLGELEIAEQFHAFRQGEKVALIAQTLQALHPRGTLADIGCFTGIAAEQYGAMFEHTVGFDTRRDVLDLAAARGIETRAWSGGPELRANDAEFDFIVTSNVIEHIFDTDAFLKELRRVLRPGGHLILTTPNLAYWISRLRLLRGKTPWGQPGASPTVKDDIVVDLSHIRLTTRREWQTLFEHHSLRVDQVRGWSIFHSIANTPPVRAARVVDRWMTKSPDLAFGLMFVLTNHR